MRLEYTYEVQCQQDYYGPDCSVFCSPADDATGHFTCDQDGNMVCLPGFSNEGEGGGGRCTVCDPTIITCPTEGNYVCFSKIILLRMIFSTSCSYIFMQVSILPEMSVFKSSTIIIFILYGPDTYKACLIQFSTRFCQNIAVQIEGKYRNIRPAPFSNSHRACTPVAAAL